MACRVTSIAALAVLSFGTVSCGGLAGRGGTPGAHVSECADGDVACATVQVHLQRVRQNIGGDCGTPEITASTMIFQLGPDANEALARALGDRHWQVARFAARRMIEMGGLERVRRWCTSHFDHRNAEHFCDGLDEEAVELAALQLAGAWTVNGRVRRSVGVAEMDHTPCSFELEEDAGVITGRVCYRDSDLACGPVEGVRRGHWVELIWGERQGIERRHGVVFLGENVMSGELIQETRLLTFDLIRSVVALCPNGIGPFQRDARPQAEEIEGRLPSGFTLQMADARHIEVHLEDEHIYTVELNRRGVVQRIVVVDDSVVVPRWGPVVGRPRGRSWELTCEGRGNLLNCHSALPQLAHLILVFDVGTDDFDGRTISDSAELQNVIQEGRVMRAVWEPE